MNEKKEKQVEKTMYIEKSLFLPLQTCYTNIRKY